MLAVLLRRNIKMDQVQYNSRDCWI